MAAALCTVCTLAHAPRAVAQTKPSVDARTWRPSTDAEANLVLEPVVTPGPWRWNAGAWLAYARDPVSWNGAPAQSWTPVRDALSTDLVAALGLGERASIGLDVPLLLWQDGASSLPGAVVAGGSVPGASIGDVVVTGKAAVVSNDRQGMRGGFGVALLASVSVPTGDRRSFFGDGALTSSLALLGEYALGVVAVRASAGYLLRTGARRWPGDPLWGVPFGDALPWALGIALRPEILAAWLDSGDRQTWEVAAHGALPAGPIAPFGLGDPGATLVSPALLSVDDRVAVGHGREVSVVVGCDIGLDTAVGVPPIRGVVSVAWAPRTHDKDMDGVPDDIDECPDLAEDADGIQDGDGCPEDDADADGILDTSDACPLAPGVPSPDPKKNGCPAPGAP